MTVEYVDDRGKETNFTTLCFVGMEWRSFRMKTLEAIEYKKEWNMFRVQGIAWFYQIYKVYEIPIGRGC